MAPNPARLIMPRMWTVTTSGDLPDEQESRHHAESPGAWNDYAGRIVELEINGYMRDSETAVKYGSWWICELSRGQEQISVSVERAAGPAPQRT